MILRSLLSIFIFLLAYACIKPPRVACEYTFASNTAKGSVNGISFQMQDGFESVEKHGVFNYYKIDLIEDEVADSNCEGKIVDTLTRLNIHTPINEGLYETVKGADIAVKLMHTDSNYLADCAAISIDEIYDTTISGKVYAHFEGDDEINGTFFIRICR